MAIVISSTLSYKSFSFVPAEIRTDETGCTIVVGDCETQQQMIRDDSLRGGRFIYRFERRKEKEDGSGWELIDCSNWKFIENPTIIDKNGEVLNKSSLGSIDFVPDPES